MEKKDGGKKIIPRLHGRKWQNRVHEQLQLGAATSANSIFGSSYRWGCRKGGMGVFWNYGWKNMGIFWELQVLSSKREHGDLLELRVEEHGDLLELQVEEHGDLLELRVEEHGDLLGLQVGEHGDLLRLISGPLAPWRLPGLQGLLTGPCLPKNPMNGPFIPSRTTQYPTTTRNLHQCQKCDKHQRFHQCGHHPQLVK